MKTFNGILKEKLLMKSLEYDEKVFRYYFYFIQERMKIFWARARGEVAPWSDDTILRDFRFTNVYRAIDRVSQYLIRHVIYDHANLPPFDIALRIIVFKIFNKVETWEYLEKKLGLLHARNFDVDRISTVLSERRRVAPIFNNAYMMTGTHSKYNYLHAKHEKWLTMLYAELVKSGGIKRILEARSLSDIYTALRSCSMIGDFLAYQYSIDLNYAPFFGFDENSFVKAGIGAVRGIRKCFRKLNKQGVEDAIYYTQNNFRELQRTFGFDEFEPLHNRLPTLIDLQNCFCETDKYLRAKLPELVLDNTRIKQRYKHTGTFYSLFFPPLWKVDGIGSICT